MASLITKQVSESITENIFRNYYGPNTFIEKSAIPKSYGFTQKRELVIRDIQIFSKI